VIAAVVIAAVAIAAAIEVAVSKWCLFEKGQRGSLPTTTATAAITAAPTVTTAAAIP